MFYDVTREMGATDETSECRFGYSEMHYDNGTGPEHCEAMAVTRGDVFEDET